MECQYWLITSRRKTRSPTMRGSASATKTVQQDSCNDYFKPHPHHQHRRRSVTLSVSTTPVQDALDELQQTSSKHNPLPIFDILPQIQASLKDRPNLLLEAPPGAGKTTVVPLALLAFLEEQQQDAQSQNHKNHHIIVVEPRRVATRSAAYRMASMLPQKQSIIGQTVGYAVRGDARVGPNTRITVMTDGVLLNKLRDDPELTGVAAICFDEFHERGVGSDTALALCVEIQQSLRPNDLRLIVMSATLFNDNDDNNNDESILKTVLGGDDQCRVLVSDGRMYPIDVQWGRKGYPPLGVLMKSRNDLVTTMCTAIEEALRIAPAKGDVLAFLPGAREIERVVQELTSTSSSNDLEILPLYGTISKERQDYALYPSATNDKRRVIVSSPIAEASLTLERVTCVVDSGLRREPRCDVDTGMPRLVTTRISKASAKQRAGRAGRVQQGLCLRLYSESEYKARFLDHSPPEISNTDLVPTLLLLADWGCSRLTDIHDIPFVDPPDMAALSRAYDTLVSLEVLEETDNNRFALTVLGRSIAKLPTHPRLGTAIERAENKEKLAAAVIVSCLLDDDINVGSAVRDADLASRTRVLLEGQANSFAAGSVLQYAARISENSKEAVLYFMNNPSRIRDVLTVIGEALLPGFVDLIAERKSDASYGGSTYMLSLGRSARLDGIQRDAPDFIVVADTTTSDDGIVRIRSYAPITSEVLYRVAKEKEVAFTVPSRGYEVRAKRSLFVGSLELRSTPLPKPSSDEVTKILLKTIRSLGGVKNALLENLSGKQKLEVGNLRERVRLATSLGSSSDWPACFAALDAMDRDEPSPTDINVSEQLVEPWLAPAGSLKGIAMLEVLQGTLSTDRLMQLNRDFPQKIEAPDGTTIPIQYFNGVPKASAKLQQFFGTNEPPQVGPPANRIAVTLSLLSPAGKELAQTVDLPFFWKETYPAVRAEMRGRYSKHPWPEDPTRATPTRQTKKQQALATSDADNTATKPKKKKRGKK
eukprot:scaffold2767_cov177-Amphora_coffeaeformis.AAC.14